MSPFFFGTPGRLYWASTVCPMCVCVCVCMYVCVMCVYIYMYVLCVLCVCVCVCVCVCGVCVYWVLCITTSDVLGEYGTPSVCAGVATPRILGMHGMLGVRHHARCTGSGVPSVSVISFNIRRR